MRLTIVLMTFFVLASNSWAQSQYQDAFGKTVEAKDLALQESLPWLLNSQTNLCIEYKTGELIDIGIKLFDKIRLDEMQRAAGIEPRYSIETTSDIEKVVNRLKNLNCTKKD